MRNYSGILTFGLIALFVVSLGFSFYKFYIVRDYIVYGHTECDPSMNRCFVSECDPKSGECSGNPEEDTEYYVLIEKNASQIAVCDPHTEECEALSCKPDEVGCKVYFCDEESAKKEEVKCSNPNDFKIDELEEGTVEEDNATESEDGETANEPAIIKSGNPGLTEDPLEIPKESQKIPALSKDKALE